MLEDTYKLIYSFQEKDERDYTHKTIVNPNNNKLELTTITKKGEKILKATKQSPPTFVLTNLPPILQQGNLGSCVLNAFAYTISKQTNKVIMPSRLYLYAISRILGNKPLNQDTGTTITSACKSIQNYGVCQETVYPYIPSNVATFPPLNVFNNSKKFKSFTYLFIMQDLVSLKNALQTYNSPIIFGIMVYPSFMSAINGNIPLPNTQTEKLLGGHCVSLIGYNDVTKRFTCANSWGINWGAKGYFTIPYAYVLNAKLAANFCATTFVY
jgi:C1A family cysteine protease